MALVRAAKQLISELEPLGLGKIEVLKERDGLGFQRELRFDKDLTTALGDDVLAALAADPRVEQTVKSNKGVRIVFVADHRADFDTRYEIASALR